jgi:predicted DNA-binding transcriptional regulator
VTTASLDTDLKGNTLKVYTYIFRVQRAGIREVQRTLGLKSASLAQYHLDKLVEMGLATRDNISGEYMLAREIKVESLEKFLKVGTHMVPRFLLYSVTLSVLLSYFVFITLTEIKIIDVWGFVFAIFGVSVTWFETLKAWRSTP